MVKSTGNPGGVNYKRNDTGVYNNAFSCFLATYGTLCLLLSHTFFTKFLRCLQCVLTYATLNIVM